MSKNLELEAEPMKLDEAGLEAALKAFAPDLFGDDPLAAHMAASPLHIEAAKRPEVVRVSRAITAYLSARPSPVAEPDKPFGNFQSNWDAFMEAFERVAGESRDQMKHDLRAANTRIAELEAALAPHNQETSTGEMVLVPRDALTHAYDVVHVASHNAKADGAHEKAALLNETADALLAAIAQAS